DDRYEAFIQVRSITVGDAPGKVEPICGRERSEAERESAGEILSKAKDLRGKPGVRVRSRNLDRAQRGEGTLHHNTVPTDPLQPLLGATLILVAHPDDEVIACGALMQRMEKAVVLFATDGAPRDERFWKQHGSRYAYAGLRR